MPAYINNKGEILAEAPLHHQVSEFFLNLYLALIFFFQTLINVSSAVFPLILYFTHSSLVPAYWKSQVTAYI